MFTPPAHDKKLGLVVCSCGLSTGRLRQEDMVNSLVGQSSRLVSSGFRKGLCLKKIMRRMVKGDASIHLWPLHAPFTMLHGCVYPRIQVYSRMHNLKKLRAMEWACNLSAGDVR